jgi:hypothetical protein
MSVTDSTVCVHTTPSNGAGCRVPGSPGAGWSGLNGGGGGDIEIP